MSHRRNPFNKKEEEETDLKKMSRGLPDFKNFPEVTNRPDQEIQNVDTERQQKIFARKAANASNFNSPIVRGQLESQVKEAIKPPTPQFLASNKRAAKERWGYDMPEEQFKSKGMVVRGKKPVGMVQGEGQTPTGRRREHEAIHFALEKLGEHYGNYAQGYAQKKMNELIHPSVSNHLSSHLSQVGYHPSAHPMELVTHLYEMLHDPKLREMMRHSNPEFKEKEREIMHHAKKSWNAIRNFASKLRPEDVG